MLFFISVATAASTFLGGMFVLRFRDKLHLILGFSAGAIIGAAFFDIIPEAIELASDKFDVSTVMGVMALGFVGYMLIDRFVGSHSHEENPERGRLGAGSLSIHSFLDGAAIGLAFKVSSEVGLIVTAAVLFHNFSDGINTVNLILKNGGSRALAFRWLLLDAAAPVLGILSTSFFTLPATTLGLLLASFGGFFLYIGASDLLPESHHRHPTVWTTGMTLIGMAALYLVANLAGI